MAGEMFGAPAGITAGESASREQLMGALNAQHRLGQIAAQPSAQRLAESHARLYEAQADEAERKADAQAKLAWLAENEPVDVQGAVEGAKAGGQSLANPLIRFSKLAAKAGLFKESAEFATKASTIAQHEASAGASQASEGLRKARTLTTLAQNRASQALAVTDQGSYDRLRQSMVAAGESLDGLPENYAAAQPTLKQWVQNGIAAQDALRLAEQKAHNKVVEMRLRAQAGASGAAAEASKARVKLSNLEYDNLVKNGGERSPEAKALKDARRRNQDDLIVKRDAAAKAKELAKFPPAPPAEVREKGKAYTIGGQKAIWWGTGWQLLQPGEVAAASADDTDEDDDE